ncbi:hypothetical protein ACW9H0_07405 [Pseudomonas monsensis]
MGRGVKLSLLAALAVVVFVTGAILFVPPQRALSAAIMRDCIHVVKDKARGAGGVSVFSVVAIQPDPNKRKLEDFNRATQASIERGVMIPSEPSVLLEFETGQGTGKALCTYHANLWTESGTYSDVSIKEVQIGLGSLSELDMVLMKRFDVGRLDRVLSLIPIFGSVQKFYLD